MKKFLIGIIGIAMLCVGLSVVGCHSSGDVWLDGPNYEDIPDPTATTPAGDEEAATVVERQEIVCFDISGIKIPFSNICGSAQRREGCDTDNNDQELAEITLIKEKLSEIVKAENVTKFDYATGKDVIIFDLEPELDSLEKFDIEVVEIVEVEVAEDIPDGECYIVIDKEAVSIIRDTKDSEDEE